MRKVLVPFDGSKSALHALQYAIKLAKRDRLTSIHVVTAHEEPVIYGEIEVYISRNKMADLQREHSGDVLASAENVLKKAAVPHTKEILIGPIAEVIAKRAQTLHCDSIVMGTSGLTAIAKLVIGSVAMKIVHLANVPVTLVK
jgi:nucleotide-binding universal stress UspA family protein